MAALLVLLLAGCSSGGPVAGDAGSATGMAVADDASPVDDASSSDAPPSTTTGSDASGGGRPGTLCVQAAARLGSCGLSTGGIESRCDARNACYSSCILAASCAELQGPLTATNGYTSCLSQC